MLSAVQPLLGTMSTSPSKAARILRESCKLWQGPNIGTVALFAPETPAELPQDPEALQKWHLWTTFALEILASKLEQLPPTNPAPQHRVVAVGASGKEFWKVAETNWAQQWKPALEIQDPSTLLADATQEELWTMLQSLASMVQSINLLVPKQKQTKPGQDKSQKRPKQTRKPWKKPQSKCIKSCV